MRDKKYSSKKIPFSFKHKRILITGITGFVGSHLAKKLIEKGAYVFGTSKTVKSKNILKANIINYSALDTFIKDAKIEICFHLAGESLVEFGQKYPYSTFKVNTQGTLNILEIARKYKLEKIVIASTSHVYGENKIPYYEGYTPRPSRPYETSKACTDLIAQAYAENFGLPVLIPRFVNIYGPGDLHFDRLIPKTMRSVFLGESPKIWGGDALRDYLYIDDAINAYIELAKVNISDVLGNRVFNFGSGNPLSVRQLVTKIINLSGKELEIISTNKERIAEIKTQYVSWKKAMKLLGWQPKTSLEEGLKKTLTWYEEYFSRK